MIPTPFIKSWQPHAQWRELDMVEHDLIICRALICLYTNETIKNSLAFRGGTALNKLYIKPGSRYSEDIDFVQKRPEPIGQVINNIRDSLKDWLGEPKRKITQHGAKLIYSYQSTSGSTAKLKIEINTTEHFQVLPLIQMPFSIDSEWFKGACEISTYSLEELMATKLRALYQRRKGRDLFDMWYILTNKLINVKKTINVFRFYWCR